MPCALLSHLDSTALPHLSTLFWHVATTAIPDSWKISAVTAVYKKGPPDVASNYRAICVMGPVPKLFMSCLNRHITDTSEAKGWRARPQAGFRAQHRREDLIIALDYLVDRSLS